MKINQLLKTLRLKQIIGLDFETYFEVGEYSLRSPKTAMSEYVRDKRFKAQCVAIQTNKQRKAKWIPEYDGQIKEFLETIDWSATGLLAHNAAFDGFILSQHYNIVPAFYFDSLSMARPLFSNHIGAGLDEVAKHLGYAGKEKSEALQATKNIRNLPRALMNPLGEYCKDDVQDMMGIFKDMLDMDFPLDELKLIHHTIKAFADPICNVDVPLAKKELANERRKKTLLFKKVIPTLQVSTVDEAKTDLAKGIKLAEALQRNNVKVPMKPSPAHVKAGTDTPENQIYAFAKGDLDFQKLQRHSNKVISDLIEARMAVKSTIGETRAARMVLRGTTGDNKLPLFLNYGKAHTLRWCMPGNTEVLTPQGWVSMDTWNNQQIMQWQPDGSMSFTETSMNEFDFDGDLITLENEYIKGAFTPEHKLATFTSKNNFKARTAIKAQGLNLTIPVSGKATGKLLISPLKLALMVAFQADGCFDRTRITFGFRKERKKKMLEDLLKALKIKYKRWEGKQETIFAFSNKEVPELTKTFPIEWLQLTDTLRLTFLTEVQFWDGGRYKNGMFRYYTTHKQNAEFVATMAHITGMRAHIHIEKREPVWRDKYTVQYSVTQVSHPQKKHWGEERHNGKVYCPTVPTGFFLVRFKGAIHVTGNSGGDKFNPQNFVRGGNMRKCIKAPKGYKVVVVDSSQIEARMNAWLWEQNDLLELFATGKDPYKALASSIYGIPEDKITKAQRFVGKVGVLGLGYQMGAEKFQYTLEAGLMGPPMIISLKEAEKAKNTYRRKNHRIVAGWYFLERMLEKMYRGEDYLFRDILYFQKEAITTPSGFNLYYPDMHATWNNRYERYQDFSYKSGRQRSHIYGGMLDENIVQHLARLVVAEQLLMIAERYRIITMTHDEVVYLAKNREAPKALKFGLNCFRIAPDWCSDIPLDAEGGYDDIYSK